MFANDEKELRCAAHNLAMVYVRNSTDDSTKYDSYVQLYVMAYHEFLDRLVKYEPPKRP